ncbi:MAG TPA: hypothetical protein VKD72_31995 [Gemmataceae bacterium]|nr:hypothetical protein [Gemmataceae bacterium]
MIIRFECNHCRKKLGIADTEAGKMIKCPGCGEKVRIPSQGGGAAPPETMKKPPGGAAPPETMKKAPSGAAPAETMKKPPGSAAPPETMKKPPVPATLPPKPPSRPAAVKPPSRPAAVKPPPPEEDENLVDVEPVEDEPPARAAKAKAPARHEEDEEDEPRRDRRRAKARRDEDEEDEEDRDRDEDEEVEEDEEKGIFSPNRIRGVVSIVLGGAVLAVALFYPRLQESDVEIMKWGMCGLAALMFGAGIFYLIKG